MPSFDHISAFLDDLISIRHDLHAHPEIGFEEVRTSGVIAGELASLGIEVHHGVGGTGVVGILRNGEGPTIGLRSDMDALPMQEMTNLSYRSIYENRFHGCGHDGHMTMLLGAARYLAQTRRFKGTAAFIFQPAEEGLGGSRAMIGDGLFERFPCDEIYALHNAPHHEKGRVVISQGAAMAGADFFDIRVTGTGGHAALPDTTRDPIIAATGLIQSLQSIVSRNVNPLSAAVISVTKITAGDAYNVIPEHVDIAGTIRTLDDQTRLLIRKRVEEVVKGCAATYDVTINVEIRDVFTVLNNHPEQTAAVIELAHELVGVDNVDHNAPPFMASEDFADMLRIVPGAYFFLGQGRGTALHNPSYVFNDEIIPVGVALLAGIVEKRSMAITTQ